MAPLWNALAFRTLQLLPAAQPLKRPVMSILVFAIIVLVVAALIAWAVEKLPLPSPFGRIIQALILIVAAVVIAQRAGIF
jgi:cation transporter-like permease